MVRRRGLQWRALPYRVDHGRVAVRVADVSLGAAPAAIPACIDRAPIVANWIRAYVTVLIAHLTNNQWMAGSEHVTFGQILFSAVLLLMFWIGARWREDDPQDDPAPMSQRRRAGGNAAAASGGVRRASAGAGRLAGGGACAARW